MNNTKKKQRGRLGETWHQLKKNKFAIVTENTRSMLARIAARRIEKRFKNFFINFCIIKNLTGFFAPTVLRMTQLLF